MRTILEAVWHGDNQVVREVWNGAWFSLALGMIVILAAITLDRIRLIGSWKYAYDDTGVQICLALTMFVTASGARAAYIWLLLHCENFYPDCTWITEDDWIMTVAGAIAIAGGLCTIRVLSPRRWLPWSWLVAGAFAIGMPILYYTLEGAVTSAP